MAALPFPTFGTDQQGITPVQLQAGNVGAMFPKSRGPVRRAPEPTDKEILGPLAPFAVEGLMSLPFFGGKGKQSPAEYLESIGATPDQIADPSKLDEIDRAKYDAYRIYGPETERDTFGWDELAHMAGAVSMDRGGPGYAQSYLSLRGAKERDRLAKETKRQAHINDLLAPVSLQHMTLENKKGEQIIGSYHPTKGILLNTDGNELDGKEWGPVIDNRTLKNYEDTTRSRKEGLSTPILGYQDPITGDLWVHEPEHPQANARGYRDAALGGNWALYNASTASTYGASANDPKFEPYMETVVKQREADGNTIALLEAAVPAIDLIEDGIKNIEKAPTTYVAGLLRIGDNVRTNFVQAAEIMGGGTLDDYFAKEGDDSGFGDSGYASKRLWYAYNAIPEGELVEGIKQFSDIQLKEIEEAERIFEVETGTNLTTYFGGVTKYLSGDLAYANIRVKGSLLSLAYQAAAANGQTGRTLSDKDLQFHLDMVGYDQTQTPQVMKDNLIDFIDTMIRTSDSRIRTNFSRDYLAGHDFDNPDYYSQARTWYQPQQERILQPENPYADKDGYVYQDRWERGPDTYQYKDFRERYGAEGRDPRDRVVRWYQYDSPARKRARGERQEERIRESGFSAHGTRRPLIDE